MLADGKPDEFELAAEGLEGELLELEDDELDDELEDALDGDEGMLGELEDCELLD